MNKALSGICIGVATLLIFLVLAIFALGKKEILFGILCVAIGCGVFVIAMLYALTAICRRHENRGNIISCRNCGSAFGRLAQNNEACPECGSRNLMVMKY